MIQQRLRASKCGRLDIEVDCDNRSVLIGITGRGREAKKMSRKIHINNAMRNRHSLLKIPIKIKNTFKNHDKYGNFGSDLLVFRDFHSLL
jgi:hypothetical protein